MNLYNIILLKYNLLFKFISFIIELPLRRTDLLIIWKFSKIIQMNPKTLVNPNKDQIVSVVKDYSNVVY